MQHNSKVDIRSELIERVRLELVGPNSAFEELDERPTQRYLTGILWPLGTQIEKEDDEELAAGDEGEETGMAERIAPLKQAMKPSSIGLSFVVESGHDMLQVSASWGIYHPVSTPSDHWKREQINDSWMLCLQPADGIRQSLRSSKDSDIRLEYLARAIPNSKRIAVSLFLVNRKVAAQKGSKDPYCLFQPELKVQGSIPGDRPFVVRALEGVSTPWLPQDVEADELLYRYQTTFAIGHGTAVNWSDPSEDHHNTGRLQTVTLPMHEVPQVSPPEWKGAGTLDMKRLADPTIKGQIANELAPLVDAYGDWILQQEQLLGDAPSNLQSTGRIHLDECRRSLERMRKGLDLLRKNLDVQDAFQFANQAMASQRVQALWARHCRETGDWSQGPDYNGTPTEWRPFQIGFILQSMTSVVDPTDPDRGIADLLWFPTGGGKTEAYLGLAAFTMALRRLRGEQDGMRGDAGVNVIMRYTLRLLTVQQFQRAATLICACEMIRQKDPKQRWGKVPFRLGLWVGGKNTPNTFDECIKFLNGTDTSGGSPIQLVSCPWCGHPLSEKKSALHRKTYFADPRTRRLFIGCSWDGCDFHKSRNRDGIPALVVDEEIYRLAPTLLIGTVDKFARMPWLGETQSLFGHIKGEIDGWGFVCDGDDEATHKLMEGVLRTLKRPVQLTDTRRPLPPELIIQDELHLIGGPLGTMVGLYESAIDWLCSRTINGATVGPKVVASTATIRRANEQVKRLFAREVSIFPSPGLAAGHSFFAEEQPSDMKPGRQYVGIFAPGRSVKTALVRVYAALLASPGGIKATAEDLDPYQTLVGYFNSLRELGGAVRLLEDDVRARIKVLAGRKYGQRHRYAEREMRDKSPELTSRVDSGDIPEILARLERTFVKSNPKQPPVDAVLATNMISVGVDVTRLGLMIVTGQPKTSAEYIQATSRVGREHPGLVFIVYNWARPRDLSHYERFESYHAALYRYVEAISVTPFSSRARDRALAAAFVAMCRLGASNLAKREDARRFKASALTIKRIREALLKRVQYVDEPSRLAEVDNQLGIIMDRWEQETAKDLLFYSASEKYPHVLHPLGKKSAAIFPAPNSMRDVEPSIGIYLRQEESQ